MYISSVIAGLFLVTSYAHAASPLTTIKSQEDFCIFLPPKPGLEVAVNENNGIPFCSNKNAVPNATEFPKGKSKLESSKIIIIIIIFFYMYIYRFYHHRSLLKDQ